jgi:branched-chain amino acid transport system ATP-binding protein
MGTMTDRQDVTGAQVKGSSAVPCLALRGLSKHFGGLQAVKDISLEIRPGDRQGILGPNGAGKTTLFHLITGVVPPSNGQILLFGRDVSRWPPHRRTALGMARTFQITTLFPKLTVLDNVLLAVQGRRRMKFVMWRPLLSYLEVYDKARALLEGVGFWDRRQAEIRHLSHGEQRQLEIVLALASDPQLLLLDEPAAGLSTGESQEMAAFLRRLDPHLAILMIEHDMDVAFAVVDSITVLHYGEVVEAGSLEQIRTSSRVRDIYLGTR